MPRKKGKPGKLPLRRLQSAEEYGFFAGKTREGGQLLLGKDLCSIVAIRFDARGKLISFEDRFFDRQGNPIPEMSEERPFILEPGAGERVEKLMDEWKREQGFREKTIAVEEFSLPGRSIGVEELASHHVDFLEDPESDEWTDEDRVEIPREIAAWRKRGSFVLYWNEDYYMDRDGSVGSS